MKRWKHEEWDYIITNEQIETAITITRNKKAQDADGIKIETFKKKKWTPPSSAEAIYSSV